MKVFAQAKAADWGQDQDLWPVINLVHAATGLPILSRGELSAVLASLAQDLAEQPFQLSETGKRVRDRCRDGGHAVRRGDVSFVLKGIQLGGHDFGAGADDPQAPAQRFVGTEATPVPGSGGLGPPPEHEAHGWPQQRRRPDAGA